MLQENSSYLLLTQYPDAVSLSSPFDIDGSYSDDSWSYGTWNGTAEDVPTKAVITVTDASGDTYTVENTSLTGEPSVLIP